MIAWMHRFRFELLLSALVLVLFDKILVMDDRFYTSVVWPVNMVFLGLASLGIFHESRAWERVVRNLLFLFIIAVPLAPGLFFGSFAWTLLAFQLYIVFYSFLFYSVMLQVTARQKVSHSVIVGSLSGFLLLVVLATFSFLLMDLASPGSFSPAGGDTMPEKYQQLTYFSLVTLTTVGYGDILPLTEQSRLLAGFWGVISQFYMVAIVGILISKFTAN